MLLLLATGNSINVPRKPRTAKPWMQDGFITNESRNSLALPSVVIGIMVFWVSKRPSNHLPRGWSDDPKGIEPLHLVDSRTLKRIRLEGRSFQSPQRSFEFENEIWQPTFISLIVTYHFFYISVKMVKTLRYIHVKAFRFLLFYHQNLLRYDPGFQSAGVVY